jgi:hypothetical protein
VHRSTIRRSLARDRFPNAYKEAVRGWWRIPVTDLEAAGLRPNRAEPTIDDSPDGPLALLQEVERLRRQLHETQLRAASAEALATERAERIADLRMAFRALQAGTITAPREERASAWDQMWDDRHGTAVDLYEADLVEEHDDAIPVRREQGRDQRIAVRDITPPPSSSKEPDLVSLAMDALKVFTSPIRRRR